MTGHRVAQCRSAPTPKASGFSLVELLVAMVVAGTVLSAAYGWLWSVGASARLHDDRAQAGTIAAAAARSIAADVHAALAVAAPGPAYPQARALVLVHDHAQTAQEIVTIVWDPARRVVWRNASGTYVADHVSGFEIAYDLADGSHLTAAAMTPALWSQVRAVRVTVSTSIGERSESRSLCVRVGP